ncbi:MAG: signal peptidase II [Bacteroidia bacterium]|nr:signal peptidase II [Bacteroidia bacterium]MCX7764344.1 signal peptidase II [Bacteroidia bacterium]MDW8057962.1 signal peptidase II [Bacteroidia bacterium]
MKLWHRFLLVGLSVLLADQLTKIYIKLSYPLGHEIPWIGRWLKLHYVENPGAAFGLSLSSLFSSGEGPTSEATPKILLTLISLGITIGIGFYLYRLSKEDQRLVYPSGLIVGGAIGNLTDRIFYGVLFASKNHYQGGWFQGHVVDFIYVDIWQGVVPSWVPIFGGEYMALWPVFNIADSCITVGVIWLLLLTFRKKPSATRTGAVSPTP